MSVNKAAREWLHDEEMSHYAAQKARQKLTEDSSEETPSETPAAPAAHRASWTPRILTEAVAAVTGERNADYGDPWEGHQRTAEVWRWWLKARFGVDLELTALDVCQLNTLQKASRLAKSLTHWDSWKDQAGYAGNAGACIDHQTQSG